MSPGPGTNRLKDPSRTAIAFRMLLVVGMIWVPQWTTADTTVPPTPPVARFGQVSTGLFRGGQPDAAAFEELKQLGIRTIVNLRRSDEERRTVEALGLRYVDLSTGLTSFGLSGGIEDDVVRRFFEVIDDPTSGPVFVHCRRGADRTGTVIAMYRIARQGWPAEAAYEEARSIGMRWWHFPVKGQLEAFAAQHVSGVKPTPALPASQP